MGAMYSYNGEIKIMPGIKTTVVDPSGAGDIFHGAFAYCIANGFDLEKAITYSNITAGLSVGKMGGRPSIPTLKEVINYYNQKFNIVEAPPVEEKKPAVSAEDELPDIPDASKIVLATNQERDLGSTFCIGGATIPTISPDNPNGNV